MKNRIYKIVSLILSLGVIFSNCEYAFAGGVNKEETLSDGTKLIYVSTDRIREVCQKYWEKSEEIRSQRYSVTKDLVIKGASLAVAACGCYLSAKAGATQGGNNSSYWTLAGQVASCLLGFIGFMYPDYHEHELIEQIGSELYLAGNMDNEKNYIYQWEPEYPEFFYQGVSHILQSLYSRFLNEETILSKEKVDSGACIVIRPKSLHKKEYSINSPCFHTGVYTQLEMNEPKNPTKDHPHGYRWALENNYIPKGH